jgi:hypothetical protein
MQISSSPGGNLTFRFTDIAMGPGSVNSALINILSGSPVSINLALQDSQIRGCSITNLPLTVNNGSITLAATNNIFERDAISLAYGTGISQVCYLYNNLFLNDSFSVGFPSANGSSAWNLQDNFFNGTPQTITGSLSYATRLNNGFSTGTTDNTSGLNDQTGISTNFVTGPLGNYYQTNTSKLIYAGSRSAALAGLYHYTESTNLVNNLEVPDGANTVSIGYHYVATDSNGNPLDSNGDTIPDYLEDSNGDGVFDAGDAANWQQPANSGGTVTFSGGMSVFICEPKGAACVP